jgi:predicted  nucleic acid-binding Zn-ribbon protein
VRKGQGRIARVIDKIKKEIVELEKGIGEVDQEIQANNDHVETQKERLKGLTTRVDSENFTLNTAKTMASKVKDNLKNNLGIG